MKIIFDSSQFGNMDALVPFLEKYYPRRSTFIINDFTLIRKYKKYLTKTIQNSICTIKRN